MGDMAEYGRAMQAMRKDRHADWKRKNMEIIKASAIPYRESNRGECLTFSIRGTAVADFYPSTGRWRSGGETYGGGAEKFFRWFKTFWDGEACGMGGNEP